MCWSYYNIYVHVLVILQYIRSPVPKDMYSGPSLKGHSLERTYMYC